MLQKEGKIRIPAGCAISGIFHKDGTRENGTRIIDSIRTMHDRSNGLGGGFAGYGIYPEYKEQYALHVFYNDMKAREATEQFLNEHFDIVNLSRIPTRKHPRITDEPLIWRYFVSPLQTKLAASQLDEKEFVGNAGNGLVTVTVNGHGALRAVTVKPEAMDPDDPEMLEDLIVAAYNAAADEARAEKERVMPAGI